MFLLIRKYDTRPKGLWDCNDIVVGESQIPVESEDAFLAACVDLEGQGFIPEFETPMFCLEYVRTSTVDWIFYRVWLLETAAELVL